MKWRAVGGGRTHVTEAVARLVVDVATGDASRVAKGRGAIWLDGHTLLVEVS